MIDHTAQNHDFAYRKNIVTPLFHKVQSGSSLQIVGFASVGKSRLLQHLLRPETKTHFLGDLAQNLTFV